jgi:hypothetical protein
LVVVFHGSSFEYLLTSIFQLVCKRIFFMLIMFLVPVKSSFILSICFMIKLHLFCFFRSVWLCYFVVFVQKGCVNTTFNSNSFFLSFNFVSLMIINFYINFYFLILVSDWSSINIISQIVPVISIHAVVVLIGKSFCHDLIFLFHQNMLF